MNYQYILYDVKDHIATITFNRPDRLNAVFYPMRMEIASALLTAEADNDVRVIVLTGAGRGFCSGLDMKERAAGTNQTPPEHRLNAHPVAAAFWSMEKPSIAAINGVAVGAGFEMALLCDFRFAAAGIRMGDLHVQRNLVPDVGGPWFLPKLVGWSKACEIILGGDYITAEEALHMGAVNRVLPQEELMPTTLAYATKLARNAPQAMKLCKRLMRRSLLNGPEEIIQNGFTLNGYLMETEDFKEAMSALTEKRNPDFTGS